MSLTKNFVVFLGKIEPLCLFFNELILFVNWHIIKIYRDAIMEKIMDYLSIREVAEKWGISPRRVQVLFYGNSAVPSAIRTGNI